VLQAMERGYIESDGKFFKIPRRELRPTPMRSLQGRAFIAAGTDASMISGARMGLGRLYLGQPNVSDAARAAKESQEAQPFNPFAPAGPAEQKTEKPLPNG